MNFREHSSSEDKYAPEMVLDIGKFVRRLERGNNQYRDNILGNFPSISKAVYNFMNIMRHIHMCMFRKIAAEIEAECFMDSAKN